MPLFVTNSKYLHPAKEDIYTAKLLQLAAETDVSVENQEIIQQEIQKL